MKKNYLAVFRSLFKKGRHNEIKILALGVGLALGLVLISKVCFQLSYDDFYPDSERIYQIQENIALGDQRVENWPGSSGAVAPAIKAEIAAVEATARVELMGGDDEEDVFFTPDRKKYSGKLIMADSTFFEVLPRPVVAGNAREALSRPLYALVSKSMADRMGGEVMGLSFELNSFPGRSITIGGIFEDVPENTHLQYDVILSLVSFNPLYGWDCLDNWFGCDRFCTYIKVMPGVSREAMEAEIGNMVDRHLDPEQLRKEGIEFRLSLRELENLYSGTPEVQRMSVMLALIAFALLFAAVMNYVLIEISSLVTRTKEIAIYKCYGASGRNISGMIFRETLVHLLLSLIVAVLLIFAFRGTVEEIVKASLGALFTLRTCLVLGGVCVGIFILAGLIPSQLFMRIPVASAFRSFKESRRIWKKALLFIQFAVAAFLVALLVVIGLQYNRMVNDDPGYSYDRLVYSWVIGAPEQGIRTAMEEVERLPGVEGVSTAYVLPIFAGSGDIVYQPGTTESVLHFCDMYSVDAAYVPLMEMTILQGKNFEIGKVDSAEVLVSKYMAERLADIFDWKDGVVGKQIEVSGHVHRGYTVRGVYDDVRIGAITDKAMRPSVLFYSEQPQNTVVIKLNEVNPENMKHVEETIKKVLPEKDIVINSYKASMTDLYRDSRIFRDSVMWGGIVTLLITFIGLIGYTNDEINRRSKEIAVRKINGATTSDILLMLSADALYMALPAVLIGVVGAYIAGEKWLEQFVEKISLNPLIFVGSAVVILGVVALTVVLRAWVVANDNPVESLRSE